MKKKACPAEALAKEGNWKIRAGVKSSLWTCKIRAIFDG